MKLTSDDNQLIESAREQMLKAYEPIWHTVGSAIRLADGTIFTGVNVDASTGSGGGACAEMSALGAAISAGRKSDIKTIVAVSKQGVLPPCGVCRQTLITHAPQVEVLLPEGKVAIRDLLPYAYENPEIAG